MLVAVPAALALVLALVSAAAAQPTSPGTTPPASPRSITIELNKLEDAANACRGYFIVSNRTSYPLKELRTEVYLFDKGSVVLRRIGVTFADIRSERSKVAIFDLADVPCSTLGKLLINSVLSCTGADGAPIGGCEDLISASSRAGIELSY